MMSDINVTTFDCGCVWRWWTGEVGPQNNKWEKQCESHAAQEKPFDKVTNRECTCLNVGEDDGATTCWMHHDCYKGECTHMDNDEQERGSEDEEAE